jgi:hypothetical protein
MSDAKRSTGTIAANTQTVTLSPNGRSVVGLVLTGTWVINLDVKALIDGTEQDAVIVDKAGVAISLPLTTNQVAYIDAVGREQIIVRANGYTSGTASVTLNATDGKLPSATGGSAVSISDGSDATFGAKADAAAGSDTGTFTFMSLFKRLLQKFTTQFPAALGGTTAANSFAVTLSTDGPFVVQTGAINETAPATDTASSGLNGRLQRIAQRLTSLIAQVPAALTGSGNLKAAIVESTATVTTTGAGGTFPVTNANLDAALSTLVPTTDFDSKTGSLTEAAPASDTASSGLNGRLQRVAQRLTSLIALLPSALISNRLDVNLGAAPATVTAQGGAAVGAAAAGNPNLLGVVDGSGNMQNLKQVAASAATVTNGLGLAGVGLHVNNGGANWFPLGNGGAQADANAANQSQDVTVRDWNGTNWDRHRNNLDVTLLASAGRTTTQTSADIVTYNLGAIKVILDMTTVGTGSVTLTINEKDPASGKYILLLSGAAVVTNVTNEYTVDPVVPAVANVTAQKRVPRTIQIVVTANNANSAVYSCGYLLLPA